MADRDTTEQRGGADSPDPATIGNRPATGARVVEHAAHLPTAFGGGQEATDFLGLSQEFVGTDGGSPINPGAMPPSPSTTASTAESEGPSWLLSGTEPVEGAEAEEPEPAEEAELEPVQASGGSKRLLSFAVAVLLIGAAVTVAMRFSRKEPEPATTQLATRNPAPKPPRDPNDLASNPDRPGTGRQTILPDGTTVPVETTPPPVSSTTPEPTPTTEPVATTTAVAAPPARIAAKRLAEWMVSHGWTPSAADSIAGSSLPGAPSTPAGWPKAESFAFASNPRNGTPSAQSISDVEPTSSSDPIPLVLTQSGAQDPRKNPLSPFEPTGGSSGPKTQGPGELRYATKEDLANVWGSTAIPMEAIDGPERMVTPTVGLVRVVLTGGEIFDGRLYAVGQGQVWIETDFGRLALSGHRVREIDTVVLEKQAKEVEQLPRMRVRTQGGLFFGKVLARDDVHVTLLLDSGGRITLESNDVEPAPLGDIRVVGPVKP